MPKIQFSDLSPEAKSHALNKYRQNALDYEWWESVYDDFEQIAKIIGIEIPRKHGRQAIYFSGFASQGDGATFEGIYRYERGTRREIRKYAPKDSKLHKIVDALCGAQRRYFYSLRADITHRGHYYHELSNSIEISNERDLPIAERDEEILIEAFRDLMRWLYAQLESEAEYLTSDEAIEDLIESNGYVFDEDGNEIDYASVE